MDSQIPKAVIARRRRARIIRAAIYSCAAVVLFTVLLTRLQGGLRLSPSDVSVVETGPLEMTVSASGKVVPLYEEIITSPVSSKVMEVYRKTGDMVAKGEPVLKLDLVAVNTDYERLRDELEMKRSQMARQQVSSQTQLSELKMQISVDSMRLQRAIVLLRNEHYLDSIGASTEDRLRQAELDMKVQALQYDQLKLQYSNLMKNIAVDMQVAELDYNIAKKKLDLAARTMEDARIISPMDATLTWVNDQIGSSVTPGAQLAVVSDLEHFKVEAEIADSYAGKVSPGARAVIEIGREKIEGTVGNIVPSVDNGLIRFIVYPDKDDSPVLRSGLEADVYVVDSVKEDVMTIANRLYYKGPGSYGLWVINGRKAMKRTVTLGDSSYERVEVIDGLDNGDRVIVRDMAKYDRKRTLRIK